MQLLQTLSLNRPPFLRKNGIKVHLRGESLCGRPFQLIVSSDINLQEFNHNECSIGHLLTHLKYYSLFNNIRDHISQQFLQSSCFWLVSKLDNFILVPNAFSVIMTVQNNKQTIINIVSYTLENADISYCYFIMSSNSSNAFPPGNGAAMHPFHHPLQDIHNIILNYMWSIAINIGIFLALYRYRRYTMAGHYIIGFVVGVSTLITSMPLVLDIPISTIPEDKRTNFFIGIAIIAIIFVVIVIGALSKLLNFCETPSLVVLWVSRVHKFLGYGLTVLCKYQVYLLVKQSDNLYWIIMAQDILFVLLLIIRKLYFPTLQSRIEACHGAVEGIMSITSLRDIEAASKRQQTRVNASKDYCSFGNYVYDLKPMALMHPAGYQILHLVRNREVDRFMYGSLPAERLPKLPIYSHSFRSLDLLGPPVAKISIASPYTGLTGEALQVTIEQILVVSKKGDIYEVFLRPHSAVHFEGYSSIKQLGRFYSLTINNKTTRLYTAVNFLQKSNLHFLRSAGLYDQAAFFQVYIPKRQCVEVQLQTERISNLQQQQESDVVPLLIKVYPNGTLPNLLLQGKATKLKLSQPKGFGLGLPDIKAGTVLIVAGGTGLYPFADLIDLLYKDHLIQSNPAFKAEVLKLNPILQTKPFKDHEFQLLLACNYIEDIHPLTLHQLKTLSSSRKIYTKLRLKEPSASLQGSGIDLVNANFESLLDNQLNGIVTLSRVWLCGPPRMCESLSTYFDHKYPNQDILHFV